MLVQRRFGLGKTISLTVLGCSVIGAVVFVLLQFDGARRTSAAETALRPLGFFASRTGDDELEQHLFELEQENSDLRKHLARVEQSWAVDVKARDDVARHVRQLQDEMLTLREEVAFYRGIVAYDEGHGLDVQSFELTTDGDRYDYQIVLIHNLKNDKVVHGTMTMSVAGHQRGQAKTFSMAEISDLETDDISFEFKYFERLRGQFTFPEGFVPEKVYVFVSPGGEEKSVEKSFDWPLSDS